MNQGRLHLPIWLSKDPLVVLAPMAGVSDFPFRKAVHAFGGIGFSVSEMIASQAVLRQAAKTIRRCFPLNNSINVMQLAGNDPQLMIQAAHWAADQGAQVIDLNLGCPAKQIAISSYAGAALMRDEPLAAKIFEAVASAVSVPVSVKMRMGWDAHSLNAERIIQLAYDSGISWVTVHGRTRCQFYKDAADWEFIQKLAATAPLPVIGNGDITDVYSAEDRWRVGHISGIMIGRGAYGKPWFLSQVCHYLKTGMLLPDPPLSQQHDCVRTHAEDMLTYYGTEMGSHMLRKHLGWYSKGAFNASTFRQKVFHQTDPKEILHAIDDFYHERIHEDTRD